MAMDASSLSRAWTRHTTLELPIWDWMRVARHDLSFQNEPAAFPRQAVTCRQENSGSLDGRQHDRAYVHDAGERGIRRVDACEVLDHAAHDVALLLRQSWG